MDWMPQAIRDGIIVVLVISGPLVLAAAFIGLVIGVLQAATQVQEQTIGSALKIIGVFALIMFAGFWMYKYLNNYTSRILSSAFTFVPRQTQKAIPSHLAREGEPEEGFEEKINAESLEQPIRVIPPEKIETRAPEGGLPPGVPYLGAPEVPKAPSVSKIAPLLPQLPPQKVIKPEIPLAGFQEPKSISKPTVPGTTQIPQDINPLQPDEINNETENIDTLQINLVPGEKTEIKDEPGSELLMRKEISSDNPDNKKTNEIIQDSKEYESIPSWLN